ncbi:EamA/RhaT family transporter [Helicobacter cholecystus]|uniref:EamA/RhaT family transporter n=1 Tax=Helicobacter cholecystus TaxID=45498 RepID=A0A3D8IXK5_9HELI|nr:DMT family transporter [Helicobacter cholecystus]RDU69997.1 EamA/RhaT family transporter [Helicobacter cholecystus]VEJ24833.1 putative integral membrane protein [Helicobacter cholecystus]
MKNQDSLGILSMLLACLFFSLMNALIKILSQDISIMQSMFFRSLLMSGFILLLFLITPLKRSNSQGGYLPLLIRTCFGGVSMLLTFYNIATIPLGIASTFAQTTPLYAVFLAYFFLKETLSPLVFIATALGFVGILLISSPSSHIPFVNIIVGILSGLGAAIALVSVRECKKYFEERVIILAFGIVATLLSLGCLMIGEFYPIEIFVWRSIEGDLWWVILIMGICGTLGQYFMTKAFILAPAGIISPIDYTKIIFSLIFGIYLGDQLPNLTSLMGMMFVIVSGVMIALPIFIKDYKRNANSRTSKNQ